MRPLIGQSVRYIIKIVVDNLLANLVFRDFAPRSGPSPLSLKSTKTITNVIFSHNRLILEKKINPYLFYNLLPQRRFHSPRVVVKLQLALKL